MAAEAVPLIFTRNVSQTRASYLVWAALGLSRLLPIVLMLAMTAEWSQRTAFFTFTLEPHRGRVLAAKVLSGLGIGVLCGCFALVSAEVTVIAARAAGRHVALAWDWPQLAGFVLFVLLTSAIGIAVGAALHNTAAAIVTYFALAAAFSLLMIPALQQVGDWVNTAQTFGWMLSGQWFGHGAQIAASAALWVGVPPVHRHRPYPPPRSSVTSFSSERRWWHGPRPRAPPRRAYPRALPGRRSQNHQPQLTQPPNPCKSPMRTKKASLSAI